MPIVVRTDEKTAIGIPYNWDENRCEATDPKVPAARAYVLPNELHVVFNIDPAC